MNALPETISVSDDGFSLPISELLTGRGAAFGKSGSGKSNSVSVIAEELLSLGLPLVIVDIEGEYWGLTERFDVTYAGTAENADVTPSLDTVDELVSGVLFDNRPLVVDLSGITDPDVIDEFLTAFVGRLFDVELEAQKPCLLLVEEIHEFLPQSGGAGDLAEVLITVAKRGRKRGLGLCGISQRPAAVDKEFITQCEWIVWHRLTWENDTKVVEKILGRERAEAVSTLETGEALVMTDWDESVTRTRFRRKETFDAGAAPDLSAFSPDELDVAGGSDAQSEAGDGERSKGARRPAPRQPSRDERDDPGESGGTEAAVPAAAGAAPASGDGSADGAGDAGADRAFDPLSEAAFLVIHVGGVARRSLSALYGGFLALCVRAVGSSGSTVRGALARAEVRRVGPGRDVLRVHARWLLVVLVVLAAVLLFGTVLGSF